MRLINTTTLLLQEFSNGTAPPYAILSHTWIEGEEVSYHDMQHGVESPARKKAGWGKINSSCQAAQAEGISYVWIDTCCIDKSNSSEVSEAINSMFSWYAGATICYAYLSDVTATSSAESFDEQFRQSRWFRRGWTLQELLAPGCVRFYSSTWCSLGDRNDLAPLIQDATSIPTKVLVDQTSDFRHCSVAQKMSWASRRNTTREEDLAYCLLGLFSVNMSPVYGEGGAEAFRRLQEEIMKACDDQTMFCWSQPEECGLTSTSALAPSPRYFSNCADMRASKVDNHETPFDLTNTGIKICVPIREITGRTYGVFRCQLGAQSDRRLAVPLRRICGTNNFVRLPGNLVEIGPRMLQSCRATDIYLAVRTQKYHYCSAEFVGYPTIVLAKLAKHCKLVDVFPRQSVTCDPAQRKITVHGRLSPNKFWVRVQSRPGKDFVFPIHPQLYGDELQRKCRMEVAYAVPTSMLKLDLDAIVPKLKRRFDNFANDRDDGVLATHVVRVRPMNIESEEVLWVDGLIQHTWIQALTSGRRAILCSLLCLAYARLHQSIFQTHKRSYRARLAFPAQQPTRH